ncbi:alkene reductase [Novosphingobium sp. AP12]|uniref:alkene reductase n=1 Tax=Novosphingobium sp. AP12 TaxID=1144305 RepID=UPI000271F6C7|nr:alkene reductase [Novosphingobium sp. AP12]EJL21275.1 NADH:flavin oxidoreductase [Novosphingobium sp. AP12]
MLKLFEPFRLGASMLANRIVMAPLTRARAPDDVATERIALYYTQRATAGLIISEGTPISRAGQGYLFNPGIFTAEQILGWRLTTRSVHAVGGKMFAQLWHVGRVSHPSIQEDGRTPVSPSTKTAIGALAFGRDDAGKPNLIAASTPRPLATEEIGRVVNDFARAAKNALKAEFDGVELHGACGYLFEQFMNPLVNDRTDQYGPQSLENRLRFTLEVVDAVIAVIGRERVGIRLTPYGQLFDMPAYPETEETYRVLAGELGSRGIAYIHVMDQGSFRIDDSEAGDTSRKLHALIRNIRTYLPETAIILAGGMTRDRAEVLIEDGTIDLAAFGQPFISNPDLVARFRNNWPLSLADRTTFYGGGAAGYIDYPPFTR